MKLNICIKLNKDKYHHFNPYSRRHYNLMQVGVIDRKVFTKGFLGNYVPHFARYKGKVYIVHGGIDYSYMHDVDMNGMYIVINE